MVESSEAGGGSVGDREANGIGAKPGDVASYIADMVDELSKLAQGARLELLSYILEVACLEARTKGTAARTAPRRRP